MKFFEALFALIGYFLLSYIPIVFVCFLWVKTTHMDIGGFLLFILSLLLAAMTYVFIKWGIVVVKKTSYPSWLSKLNENQRNYIESFVKLKKDESEKFGIDLSKKIYQYQYYRIKRIYGSPLTWSERLSNQG